MGCHIDIFFSALIYCDGTWSASKLGVAGQLVLRILNF